MVKSGHDPKVGRIAISAGNESVVLPDSGCLIKRACSTAKSKAKSYVQRGRTHIKYKQKANVVCQTAVVSRTEGGLCTTH